MKKTLDNIASSIGNGELDIPALMSYSGMSFGNTSDTSKNIWNKLFSGKEGGQPQESNANSLNTPIDNASLESIIKELTAVDKQVASGTRTWHEYHDTLQKGEKWQAKYGQETQGQIRTLEGVKNAQNAARNAAIAHGNGLNQMTIGAKVGQVALTGLSMADMYAELEKQNQRMDELLAKENLTYFSFENVRLCV